MADPEVKPLDLTNVLGKVQNRVALVGVELEGAWKALPKGVTALEADSSVFNRRAPADAPLIGELPIGPVPPAAIDALILHNHPHKINSTCGMHIHMSFERLWYYGLLMTPEYPETVIHYLTLWAKNKGFKSTHHIWPRLAGESRYCRKGFWPDIQAGTKRKNFNMDVPGHRYTQIHYCGRQNTVECRVLPMMNTPQLAIEAVHEVINITSAFIYLLGGTNRSRKVLNGKIELNSGIIYEESLETVI